MECDGRSLGVDVILGRFKRVSKKCRECKKTFQTFEEKHTDVNIAIRLIRDAEMDLYDKAIIISADSDLLTPVQEIHKSYPSKVIVSVPPIKAKAAQMIEECDERMRMNISHLEKSLLPEKINIKGETMTCPPTWSSPQ